MRRMSKAPTRTTASVITAAVVAFGLTACGGGGSDDEAQCVIDDGTHSKLPGSVPPGALLSRCRDHVARIPRDIDGCESDDLAREVANNGWNVGAFGGYLHPQEIADLT